MLYNRIFTFPKSRQIYKISSIYIENNKVFLFPCLFLYQLCFHGMELIKKWHASFWRATENQFSFRSNHLTMSFPKWTLPLRSVTLTV